MKKRTLKAVAVAVSALIVFSLSSCNSADERLKNMAFVQGIGVDFADGEYGVSLMIYDISKTSGSSSQLSGNLTRVFREKSVTIPDAITNTAAVIGKKPFFSHNRVVIIGEKLAAEGIEPLTDVFYKNAEARPYILIAVARGEASEILDANF